MQCNVYNIHHRHQVAMTAWISLSFSRFSSLPSFPPSRLTKQHPMSAQRWCKTSVNTSLSLWTVPSKNVICQFVLASLVMPRMTCLSCLNDLGDRRQVTVQLLFCGLLLLLRIDPWIRDSLHRTHVWKQVETINGNCGHYEMIYADAHVRISVGS